MEDGSYTKANQAAIHKELFNGDFPGHNTAEHVTALSKTLLNIPLGISTCEIVNKSKTTTIVPSKTWFTWTKIVPCSNNK